MKTASKQPTGIDLIADERARQLKVKRWSARHDDEHTDHSLALAACAYAAPERLFRVEADGLSFHFADVWPDHWLPNYDKRPRNAADQLLSADSMTPERRIRCLQKAGALIAAELDRLLRLNGKG